MAYYSSYYPEIETARLQIQGRIRSLQDRLYLRREVTDEMQKQQLQFSIKNLYQLLRQTIDSQTYLHNQIRNLKQEVILDKKYEKKINNIGLARQEANQRALLLENHLRNFSTVPDPRYIPYSDPLLNYSLSNSSKRNQRNQLKQQLERQYQQNLQRSLRSKEYSNLKKNYDYDKLKYEDLEEQKYASHSNSNSQYAKSNLYPNQRQIKEVTLNPYQKSTHKDYETTFNPVYGRENNNIKFENAGQQKRAQQQRKFQYNEQDNMKQDRIAQKYQKKNSKNQPENQQILDRQRQNLNKLNTSRMRDEIAKAKNEQLSKSRLQHARYQNFELNKSNSQTPQHNIFHNNNSMIERSLQKYKRYQPLNDSGVKGILKKSAQKQRLKHDPEAQAKIKESATKRIQNRMMQSWALYQDSNFKNTKHEKQHLFNTYNKECKFRREIKQKIEFQPIIQKKYGFHIEQK